MGIYKRPAKQIHRGFFYLNDETVINSLSAVEAGKVDEIVSKVQTAREGGLGASAGFGGVGLEGGKKSNSALEEEMVRTRTRFSVFEVWYQNLLKDRSIGTFSGWGDDALDGVTAGDTVEFKANLAIVPLETMFRLYYWFAEQARTPGTMFSQQGAELKSTKESERVMKAVWGGEDARQSTVIANPLGSPGPPVVMQLDDRWLIGKTGQLTGTYSVVAQVDRLLRVEEELPTIRLTQNAPVTKLELDVLKSAVEHFKDPSAAFGLTISGADASVTGPAMWTTPIAIYR